MAYIYNMNHTQNTETMTNQTPSTMNRAEQNAYITNVAKQVAKAIARWNKNGSASVARLNTAIDMWFEGMTENDAASAMLNSIVKRHLAMDYREEYRMVYPPMGMDANGNYTHDQSKWV